MNNCDMLQQSLNAARANLKAIQKALSDLEFQIGVDSNLINLRDKESPVPLTLVTIPPRLFVLGQQSPRIQTLIDLYHKLQGELLQQQYLQGQLSLAQGAVQDYENQMQAAGCPIA